MESSSAIQHDHTSMQIAEPNKKKSTGFTCTRYFDALWFCYSPVYQMTEYYRDGTFDNCRGKWKDLFDCLSLKTKPLSKAQAIMEEREKSKPHIWQFRTPEEASDHWKEDFGHLEE
ncbi:hypothetical protein O6H91_18G015300 [Diphasiastrum complanatum]|uniref:Uncharacterized protein n=1 Tax=Diphasiastrum complanatum TaxID=34168 RepID=A0ACC2AYE3_DIPCM|nr:hypothetical protein O6H91_18G015300 [Diphasiastrum complanatum]